MKFKLKIDIEKDNFQDIADRLTELFKTKDNYIGSSQEVKSWLNGTIECERDFNGIYMSEGNGSLDIQFKDVRVTLNYKTKKTGKSQKVSRLKKRDLYEFDKVVFHEFQLRLSVPNFDATEDWKVTKNKWGHSANSSIYRGKTYSKYTFKQALEESLLDLYDGDNKTTLREIIINSMSQPYYKKFLGEAMQNPEEGQKKFDQIRVDVEANNQELIEECLNKYNF